MSKNKLEELSTEELLKRRNLLKSVLIAFGIIWLLILATAIYFYITKSTFKLFIPLVVFPTTLLPLFIQLPMLDKELKKRQQL